jgi:hemolysin activation/secretion protein
LNVEARLRPTGKVGQSVLIVRVEEARTLIGSLGVDNYSPPAIGAERLGIVIGGGQSVRGYRQNIRSGDNGFRVAIEDRFTVQRNESGLSTIQLAPFVDMGAVWNQSNNPNPLADQTFLVSAGLGLLWNQAMGIDNLFLRLDYGFPFIDLSDRGNNAQDEGFYFSLRYQP